MNDEYNAKVQISELYKLQLVVLDLDLPIRVKETLVCNIDFELKRVVSKMNEETLSFTLNKIKEEAIKQYKNK